MCLLSLAATVRITLRTLSWEQLQLVSCQGPCLGTWVSQVLTGEPSLMFDLAGSSLPASCVHLDHFYSTSLHPSHVQHSLNCWAT